MNYKVKAEKLEAQIDFMRITKIIVSSTDDFDEVLEFYKENFAKDKNKSYIILACEFAEFIVEAMGSKFTTKDVEVLGLAYFFRQQTQIRVNKFLGSLGHNTFSWGYDRAELHCGGVAILKNFRKGESVEFCREFLKDVDLSKADYFVKKAIEFLKG